MTPQDMLTRAFKKIDERAYDVERRRGWYEGNHPCEFSTKAYEKTFQDQMMGLVDNQCGMVVDKRSGPLIPQSVSALDAGPVAEANAMWATEALARDAEKTRRVVRTAKWSGSQSISLVDYDHKGEPTQYPLDPANAYAEVSASGALLWLVYLWRDMDDFVQATVITPADVHWLGSNSKIGRPSVGEFQNPVTLPNRLGYVPAVVYNEGSSIIDRIRGLNGSLNTTIQVAHILSATAANPTTIWWGLQVIKDGKVTGPKPNINPQTGASDIAIPVGADESGTARRVERLESRSPKDWNDVKASLKQDIWSLASIPASLADTGGGHPSADAIEAGGVLFADVVREDRQMYDGPHSELASMYVDLRMMKLTGRPASQRFAIKYSNAIATTETSAVSRFTAMVDSGIAIKDAAIRCLNMAPEEAEELQQNAADSKAAVAELDRLAFRAGV